MRAQAHVIQGEVANLMDDLGRLDERVRKLQSHFSMAQRDVDQILTSTDKLTKRGAKIEALEFEGGDNSKAAARDGDGAPKSVDSRSGLLKLRVVDDE
jgi:DNA recombination protein RmuC